MKARLTNECNECGCLPGSKLVELKDEPLIAPMLDGHCAPIFRNVSTCHHKWEHQSRPWSKSFWMCSECEMELSNNEHAAIMQAIADCYQIASSHEFGPDAAKTIRETFGLEI